MTMNKSPINKSKETVLPLSRVRTIMKSSPDVENISQDSLPLVIRATELFIQHLSQMAYKVGKSKDSLEYNNLAEVVQTTDNMTFLREIMPRKITVKEFREIMKRKVIEGNEIKTQGKLDS
ncbi:hypothetical protein LSTR_LSTR004605 [Laodelphax striatellus]|uniref:Chromatin accessibility complex protein 1 n=1 Tax=Laodelphax striatellus TaxID=195883 RepID=A0A482WTK6_LAOST|nr:hypothetical protein LSTR_LSTR004605 [Laodelphax striatellus]